MQVSSLIPKSILSELLGTSFLKNDSDVQKLNGVQEGCQIRFRDLNFQAFQVLSLGVNLTEENKKTSISVNLILSNYCLRKINILFFS